MYKAGDKYTTKKGRTYFFILNPGNPEVKFVEAIQTYGNALINTTGGILVFGVDEKECVRGFDLSRQAEDNYKCCFDRAVRNFRPTVHPHQYRMDVVYLKNYGSRAIFEIRISAGDATEIYENGRKEMFIVKDKALYGPLFPCEIAQIVLEKYKEEIASILVNKDAACSKDVDEVQPTVAGDDKVTSEDCDERKSKKQKITWP